MKIPVTENLKEKELREYLATEESAKDFLYCIANDIEWNFFLKEKGLLKEVTKYVEVQMPEIYPLFNKESK